jgi:hypothetical protein
MDQAMAGRHLLVALQGAIRARIPLAQIAVTLREYRQQGVTRQQVQSALEALRNSAPDEETEDRILEVMDIVSGFCSPQLTVWPD